MNEARVTQHLGEGQRVPEPLGTSYRWPQFFEGPIRVPEQPGDQHRKELALHAGVGTGPIRELHFRIEDFEAPPKVRKRRHEFPLPEQRRAERHVRPDEPGRIVKPFGDTQRLLGKMLRLLHLGESIMVELPAADGSGGVAQRQPGPDFAEGGDQGFDVLIAVQW
jgi:hypothetical protein